LQAYATNPYIVGGCGFGNNVLGINGRKQKKEIEKGRRRREKREFTVETQTIIPERRHRLINIFQPLEKAE
jgi:hypothetical protein